MVRLMLLHRTCTGPDPESLGIDCPLPILYAVSAMGTKLCFYSHSRNGRLTPRRIPSGPEGDGGCGTEGALELRYS